MSQIMYRGAPGQGSPGTGACRPGETQRQRELAVPCCSISVAVGPRVLFQALARCTACGAFRFAFGCSRSPCFVPRPRPMHNFRFHSVTFRLFSLGPQATLLETGLRGMTLSVATPRLAFKILKRQSLRDARGRGRGAEGMAHIVLGPAVQTGSRCAPSERIVGPRCAASARLRSAPHRAARVSVPTRRAGPCGAAPR